MNGSTGCLRCGSPAAASAATGSVPLRGRKPSCSGGSNRDLRHGRRLRQPADRLLERLAAIRDELLRVPGAFRRDAARTPTGPGTTSGTTPTSAQGLVRDGGAMPGGRRAMPASERRRPAGSSACVPGLPEKPPRRSRRARRAEACRPSQAARRGLTRPLGPGGNSRKLKFYIDFL